MVNLDAIRQLRANLGTLFPKVKMTDSAATYAIDILVAGHRYMPSSNAPIKGMIDRMDLQPGQVINALDDFAAITTTISNAAGLVFADQDPTIRVRNLDEALTVKCNEFPKCYRMVNSSLAEVLQNIARLDLDSGLGVGEGPDMPPPSFSAAEIHSLIGRGRPSELGAGLGRWAVALDAPRR